MNRRVSSVLIFCCWKMVGGTCPVSRGMVQTGMDITVENFIRQMRTGRYETPDSVRCRLWRFDTWYYLLLFRVVVVGSRTGRRGAWSDDYIVELSHMSIKAAEACGGRVIVEDAPLLDGVSGPVVVVANHMSMFETFSLPCLIGPFKHFATVVKESLLRTPLFGDIMRAAGSMPISRRNPREDFEVVMEKGTALLNAGRSILIYPQSTRTDWFDRDRFGSIGVKLARRAGVPVVPLALRTDFQPNGRWIKDIGRLQRNQPLRFRYGPPVTVSGNGREAHAEILGFMEKTLGGWGVPMQDPARRLNAGREVTDA